MCNLCVLLCCLGKPSRDPDHPDHVPSIFAHVADSTEKAEVALSRYKRRSRGSCSSVVRKLLPTDDTEQLRSAQPDDNSDNLQPSPDTGATLSPSATCGFLDDVQMLQTEIVFLRQERDAAYQQIEELQKQLASSQLSAACIENDNSKSKFYTGLSYEIFLHVFLFLSSYIMTKGTKDSLSLKDQFFLTLVRLRLNLPFRFIAEQANSSTETVRRYFWKWIDLIHTKLHFIVSWPTRKAVRMTLPSVFQTKFPRLTAIIDCFEIFIDQSHKLEARAQTWSNYKHHNTIKVFIACTPTGAISFLSAAWGGRVSDVELVRQSGFISRSLHMPYDQILADRGFTLQDDFAVECSAELIIPAFTRGKKQLEAKDVEKSREMARVRVHIERVIGALKRRFRILQGVMPI